MKKISEMSHLDKGNDETSGVMHYLLDAAGLNWSEFPTSKQAVKMFNVLTSEFEPEDDEVICWGAAGIVFKVIDGAWCDIWSIKNY